MTSGFRRAGRRWSARSWVLSLLFGLAFSGTAQGQFYRASVGGISIDTKGVLVNAERDHNGLRQFWLDLLKPVPEDLSQQTKLRKISLRGLAQLLSELEDKAKLPDEVRFLAGLQRIEYVMVYPELNDIVLAGFGEAWKIDDRGNIVGATTGRPVMELDDLVVALRTASAAARGGIQCSIDPTQDGLVRIQQMAPRFAIPNLDPRIVGPQVEEAMGPQMISFHGVPPTSRFAQILLAADFRMKRLAMKFEPTPVRGMPSYLDMIKSQTRAMNLLPRWWLTTNYDPLLTDNDGLAWQIRGPGVKAMTEDDFLDANGERKHTGKSSPAAQKWADLMTHKYDELSLKEPIFGELRNCMDLAVIAALIFHKNLATTAALDLGALIDESIYPIEQFNLPKQVDTRCSFVRATDRYILSASGGVQINSWADASRSETGDLTSAKKQVAEGRGKLWWWN